MPSGFVKTSDAQKAVIAQLLTDDPEIREAARLYLLRGFQHLDNLMTRGDPATRNAIARSLISVVTKPMTESNDEDEGLASVREEMHEMMAEMRGEIMGRADDEKPPVPRRIVPKS